MIYRECQLSYTRFLAISLLIAASLMIPACGHSTAGFLAKGEEYLQKRKFHDAMMQFRSAVESDSGSSAAHWGLARAYENLGEFNDVVDELRKTVEFDSTNLEAKAKLGSYFLLFQPPMIAEAEKLRDEIISANDKFIEGHILTASIMAAQGKPDADVVNAVKRAIAMDPQRIQSYISLERLYMTREKAPEAEAAIKSGLHANPAAVAGYIEYGRFLMYSSRDAEAESQFDKAVSIDPAGIEACEARAEFYVTSGQMQKAEQAYIALVNIQENSPESRLELADFYDKAGRGEEAIATLGQILSDAPEYVRARYRLGDIYLARRDFAKVEEQLEPLFKINDKDTEALTLRARARLQENKAEEAIADLEEILKKTPSGREALFLMAQARLSVGQIDQANAFISDLDRYHPTYIKTGLLRIQAAFAAGDAQNALKLSSELFAKANAATPNAAFGPGEIHDLRVRAQSSRGLASLDLGKIPEAKADLAEIVRISPHSSSAMVNLAKVLTAERSLNEALELYEKALAADQQIFDAASGVVATSIKLGQAAKAYTKIDALIALNQGKGDVQAALHYLRSTIYSSERNAAGAEEELKKAIEIDGDYLPAYSAYAGLLSEQNRADEAVAQYKKILEKRPGAQIYTMLGILEDSRGNSTEAEKDYRKALELSPETPIAANNLACLIVDSQGNLDEALQLASGAVAKSPTTAGFYDTLGWVYLKKDLPLPAVEHLKKAVALDESQSQRSGSTPNPGYRARLGMALAKAGDKVAARREVESSLRNANFMSQRDVTEARSVLATL